MTTSKLPDLEGRISYVSDARAVCDQCDWETESTSNTLANASLHARRTGHTVRADQTISVIYEGKQIEPEDR